MPENHFRKNIMSLLRNLDLRNLMDNFLAKANMEMNFIFPPAKARGNSVNRNVALAHSIMINQYKLALAKSHFSSI